jgi:integrase
LQAHHPHGRAHMDTILFIPLSTAQYNLDADWAEADTEIVRKCPICLCDSIIGHGRRRKQAHDEDHDWIPIRRGRCNLCGKTFTLLPVRSPLGYGRSHQRVAAGLRLRQPSRVIVPLSAEEVATFWRSFHSCRDLAIVGLMLLDGLRSCEILSLQLADIELANTQMRVPGKGNRQRILPLPAEIIEVLRNYLRLERPLTNVPFLFVSLKGRRRGQAMTPAGLRSLFRHHRGCSRVPAANPHRFRHTFGADMVRAGIALPALQHLMGHAHIHTTMLYVQLAPQDVWREYARAVQKRISLSTLPTS